MKYQILVLDLDGTLTNSRKEITPPTLKALIEIQEAGKKVVLASGRPTYGVVPLPGSSIWNVTEAISYPSTEHGSLTAAPASSFTTKHFRRT